MQRDLHLHEELLLLALHPEKGSFRMSMYAYAVAGAILAELLLRGRLRIVPGRGRRQELELVTPAPTNDPVLDHVLGCVVAEARGAQLSKWVSRLATERRPSLAHRVADELVAAGVLHREEERVLGIVPRIRFPAADPGPKVAVVAKLEAALQRDTTEPGSAMEMELRTGLLLALAHHGGILPPNLDRRLLRAQKKRVKAMAQMDGIVGATREAIQAAQS